MDTLTADELIWMMLLLVTGQIGDWWRARQYSRASARRSDARSAFEAADSLILHRNLLDVGLLNGCIPARFHRGS